MTDSNIVEIARAAHEVNRAYCKALGDDSQPPWDDAPPKQQESAVEGVLAILSRTTTTPEEQHLAWMNGKMLDGWVWGPVKDEKNKTHPCLMPYRSLSIEQQMKDTIFRAVVTGMGAHKPMRPPRLTGGEISCTPNSGIARHIAAMDAYLDDLENRLAESEREPSPRNAPSRPPSDEQPWRGSAKAMLEELHVAMAERPGARTGQDAVCDIASWLRTNPDADAGSFQHALERMLDHHNLSAHRSACEVITKLFAASFAWTRDLSLDGAAEAELPYFG